MSRAEEIVSSWKDFFCAAIAGATARPFHKARKYSYVIECAARYADLAEKEYRNRVAGAMKMILDLDHELDRSRQSAADSTSAADAVRPQKSV
jgi:hypothetical protein